MKSHTPRTLRIHQRFKALICDKIGSQQNYMYWAVKIFLVPNKFNLLLIFQFFIARDTILYNIFKIFKNIL